MERAEAAGVTPDVSAFTLLLRKLRVEGKTLESALEAMQLRGIEANERTQAVLRGCEAGRGETDAGARG